MRQLIKNQVTDRVVRIGEYIPLRMARSAITSVNYNYVNAHRVPASGEITTSDVQLRFNNVDSDGVNHGAYLSHVTIGDTVTINGQSATITTDPIYTSSGYWFFDVDAWPFMADGNYEVSITKEQPSVFSPADLFASGEQGAWYDPSDLSTMFQDIAGTTPVTADGQTVGLILDKSKGLALGPELVTNGDFSNGTTGWSFDPPWTVVEGRATHDGSSASNIFQTTAVVANKWYKCEFDLYGEGYIEVRIGDASSILASYVNSPGHKIVYAYSNGNFVYFRSTIGPGVQLDNISVKELAGNHAVAPSDAARPLYKTDGTYHWLQFDGMDDSLKTGNIDFTATDKTTSFTGTLKSVVSLSAVFKTGSADSTAGSFGYAQDYHSSAYPSAWLFGTSDGSETFTTASYPIGSGYVSTIKYDIGAASASELVFRGNGVPYSSTNSGDAGSGSFASNPLYIGSRGSGYYLAGNIYSLIVLGREATTQEITDTEEWVAAKTGVTLP